ncbi:membrane protein [Lacticaseibacillus brantae DSM 23927]|uniref:Membrane protein n=1 Tax=Lacticaseibacillus brantae DSM 23927 TaxID=1423727 RepID=A0A0R2B5P4_9LACO|nr:DUF368 domain-containing protein [Lacticaseibacillus brantae]KRM71561.1 membrane protein [Lacticaseibacillus brantae DSM 23927]
MINFVKGIIIGLALVIPGLSGSIFAVVVGLYDKLLDAVNHFRQQPRASIRFLWPVALGAVIGILVSTKAVLALTTSFPIPSYGFFIGLVLGIGPFIIRKIQTIPFRWGYLLLSLIGFAAIYGLAKLGGTEPENMIALHALNSGGDWLTMGFAGVFSVSLMAIPGISGSVMLMVLDQYGTVYNAVSQLGTGVRALLQGDMTAFGHAMAAAALLVPFMLGAIIGLIAVAKLMGYLLKHYEALVYYAVIGIVLAAVVILIQTGLVPYWHGSNLVTSFVVIASAVIGILATIFLDRPEN